jgi:ankyrin repeat protein
LHYAAAETGRVDIVKAFIAAGAEVNAADPYSCTALNYALDEGNQDAADALIAAGGVAHERD